MSSDSDLPNLTSDSSSSDDNLFITDVKKCTRKGKKTHVNSSPVWNATVIAKLKDGTLAKSFVERFSMREWCSHMDYSVLYALSPWFFPYDPSPPTWDMKKLKIHPTLMRDFTDKIAEINVKVIGFDKICCNTNTEIKTHKQSEPVQFGSLSVCKIIHLVVDRLMDFVPILKCYVGHKQGAEDLFRAASLSYVRSLTRKKGSDDPNVDNILHVLVEDYDLDVSSDEWGEYHELLTIILSACGYMLVQYYQDPKLDLQATFQKLCGKKSLIMSSDTSALSKGIGRFPLDPTLYKRRCQSRKGNTSREDFESLGDFYRFMVANYVFDNEATDMEEDLYQALLEYTNIPDSKWTSSDMLARAAVVRKAVTKSKCSENDMLLLKGEVSPRKKVTKSKKDGDKTSENTSSVDSAKNNKNNNAKANNKTNDNNKNSDSKKLNGPSENTLTKKPKPLTPSGNSNPSGDGFYNKMKNKMTDPTTTTTTPPISATTTVKTATKISASTTITKTTASKPVATCNTKAATQPPVSAPTTTVKTTTSKTAPVSTTATTKTASSNVKPPECSSNKNPTGNAATIPVTPETAPISKKEEAKKPSGKKKKQPDTNKANIGAAEKASSQDTRDASPDANEKRIKKFLHDGSIALKNWNYLKAKNSYHEALQLFRDGMHYFSDTEVFMAKYCYAKCLFENYEAEHREFEKAKDILNEIHHLMKAKKITFPLVYLGKAQFYHKIYLSDKAEQELLLAKEQTEFVVQLYPGTVYPYSMSIKENYMSEVESLTTQCQLRSSQYSALCRNPKCLQQSAKIFIQSPIFQGYVELCCTESCSVSFHPDCWKDIQPKLYGVGNDKDILKQRCYTPDCEGQVLILSIIDRAGEVKYNVSGKSEKQGASKSQPKSKSQRKKERKQQQQTQEQMQPKQQDSSLIKVKQQQLQEAIEQKQANEQPSVDLSSVTSEKWKQIEDQWRIDNNVNEDWVSSSSPAHYGVSETDWTKKPDLHKKVVPYKKTMLENGEADEIVSGKTKKPKKEKKVNAEKKTFTLDEVLGDDMPQFSDAPSGKSQFIGDAVEESSSPPKMTKVRLEPPTGLVSFFNDLESELNKRKFMEVSDFSILYALQDNTTLAEEFDSRDQMMENVLTAYQCPFLVIKGYVCLIKTQPDLFNYLQIPTSETQQKDPEKPKPPQSSAEQPNGLDHVVSSSETLPVNAPYTQTNGYFCLPLPTFKGKKSSNDEFHDSVVPKRNTESYKPASSSGTEVFTNSDRQLSTRDDISDKPVFPGCSIFVIKLQRCSPIPRLSYQSSEFGNAAIFEASGSSTSSELQVAIIDMMRNMNESLKRVPDKHFPSELENLRYRIAKLQSFTENIAYKEFTITIIAKFDSDDKTKVKPTLVNTKAIENNTNGTITSASTKKFAVNLKPAPTLSDISDMLRNQSQDPHVSTMSGESISNGAISKSVENVPGMERLRENSNGHIASDHNALNVDGVIGGAKIESSQHQMKLGRAVDDTKKLGVRKFTASLNPLSQIKSAPSAAKASGDTLTGHADVIPSGQKKHNSHSSVFSNLLDGVKTTTGLNNIREHQYRNMAEEQQFLREQPLPTNTAMNLPANFGTQPTSVSTTSIFQNSQPAASASYKITQLDSRQVITDHAVTELGRGIEGLRVDSNQHGSTLYDQKKPGAKKFAASLNPLSQSKMSFLAQPNGDAALSSRPTATPSSLLNNGQHGVGSTKLAEDVTFHRSAKPQQPVLPQQYQAHSQLPVTTNSIRNYITPSTTAGNAPGFINPQLVASLRYNGDLNTSMPIAGHHVAPQLQQTNQTPYQQERTFVSHADLPAMGLPNTFSDISNSLFCVDESNSPSPEQISHPTNIPTQVHTQNTMVPGTTSSMSENPVKQGGLLDGIVETVLQAAPPGSQRERRHILKYLKTAKDCHFNGSFNGSSHNDIIARTKEVMFKDIANNQFQQGSIVNNVPSGYPPPQPQQHRPNNNMQHQYQLFEQNPVKNGPRIQPNGGFAKYQLQIGTSSPPLGYGMPSADEALASGEEATCVICQETIVAGGMKTGACCHEFHVMCLQSWLRRSRTCPLCKCYLVDQAQFPQL